MKVKNIMFSGFAAAILMGACGAADAATYNLASKGYVDKELSQKQSKLTAGDGISIVDDVISADTSVVATKTDLADYALAEDVVTSEEFDAAMAADGELGQAIANASQAATDAAAATTAAGEAKTEAAAAAAAAGAAQADATQAKSDAAAAATAAGEAKTTAGEAKAEAAAATTAAGEAKQAVTDLTTTVNSKADAQAVETALEGKVSTETYNTDKAALEQSIGTKADAVATTEALNNKANAADVYTKDEADALLFNKVDKTTLDDYYTKAETMNKEAIQAAIDDVKSGEVELTNYYTKGATDTLLGAKADKTAVEGIDTRVQAIENAGYQNADQVSATVSGAINTLDLANTYETKGTAASLDAALKSELQQEIQDNKYNDTAVKQDIANNAAAIAANAEDIAANAEDIAENAAAISGLQNAGYISGAGVSTQEGTFLVQSDGSGNVSLSSVAIVDENGNDLITGQPVE